VLFATALTVTVINRLGEPMPSSMVTHVEQAEPVAGRFRVEFEALNPGDETAAMVQLRAMVKDGKTVEESHIVEINFLPPHASNRAGVFFDQDRTGVPLDVVAESYQHSWRGDLP
jgi:uncharacterized protein (TIGR02588 family)